MNEYKNFSYYFDQIMEYIDYNDWLKFTEDNINENAKILDLACGSGILATLLNIDGYQTDGLDLSSDMISIANDRFKGNHINRNLYEMDMTNFSLKEKYDVVTCFFDSINHLHSIDLVKDCFICVYNTLKEGGLFLFDIFSKSKYAEMNDTDITEDFDDFSYRWKINTKDPNILQHDIIITSDEIINEHYDEYYYELDSIVDKNMFEVIKVVGDFNDDLAEDDERILVVLRKK